MSKKTGAMCIATNDFEEAKYRYEKAYKNWKDHWFAVCCEIFDKCEEWAKKYVIDRVNKVILSITDKIKKKKSVVSKIAFTYVIRMFDDCGNWIFTKIGKTNNVKRRMSEFKNHSYKKENVTIARAEVIATYEMPNDDLAESLEGLMRHHFKETRTDKIFYPNDRFECFEPIEEDFETFERYRQNLTAMIAQKIIQTFEYLFKGLYFYSL